MKAQTIKGWRVTLYVTSQTRRIREAIRRYRRQCRQRNEEPIRIRVVDVNRQPHLAEAAHVLATPTLICESPAGTRRVVGEMPDLDRFVAELLPAGSVTAPGRAGLDESGPPARPAKASDAARLIERSPEAIVVTSLAGTVRLANPAAASLLAPPDGGLVGREFGFPIALDRTMVISILRADRSPVYAELRAANISWEGEEAIAVYLREITDRKLAENALQAGEQRFRLMVEGATGWAIVILDARGRVSAWNQGGERMTGYESAEAMGRHFSCFHTDEDRLSRKAERLLGAARLRGRAEDEGWRVRQDGSRFWANVVLTAIRDEEGVVVGFCKVLRDLSERQEFARQQLELQKRDLVVQLARGVAHRFNNLMGGISASAELILESVDQFDSPDLRGVAESMRASAWRAAGITSQLLTFSQSLASQPRIVDLALLPAQMDATLRSFLGPEITLRLKTGAVAALAHVDPAQMEILLLNLTSNARDAMGEGGEFTLEVSLHRAERAPSDRRSTHSDEYVRLAFTDTGCGMSPDVQAQSFEPFFTTKDSQRDGLGLAVSSEIVRQNGGTMRIDSQPGRGTCVEVFFPRIATMLPSARDSVVLPRGNECILLVAEENLARQSTARSLQTLGYRVFEAADGAEAFTLLESGAIPELHALVTDGTMPRMGGKTLAREIHARFPQAAILFLSGYPPSPVDFVRVPEVGEAVLPKPFTLHALAHKLRELLEP